MLNSVSLAGRVANKNEAKVIKTANGEFTSVSFSIAVQESKEKVHFINIQMAGKMAELFDKYCEKGDLIGITGKLTTYKTKDGKTVLTVDGKELTFLSKVSKKED